MLEFSPLENVVSMARCPSPRKALVVMGRRVFRLDRKGLGLMAGHMLRV